MKLFLCFWVFAFAVPVWGAPILCGKITPSEGTHFFVKFRANVDRLKEPISDRYKDIDKKLQDFQEEKCELASSPSDLKNIVEKSLQICNAGCKQASKHHFRQTRLFKEKKIEEMNSECSSICSKVYEDQNVFLSGADLGFELSKTCAPVEKSVNKPASSQSSKAMN